MKNDLTNYIREDSMSNFICPHCQQIIDDGSDGFTSDREIELEKKLEIAVKALEKIVGMAENVEPYEDMSNLSMCGDLAQQALKEIEG